MMGASMSPAPSGPPTGNVTGTRFTHALGIATLASIALLAVLGLFVTPADAVQRNGVRIMYVHVPSVWLAYLAFVVTGVASAAYLWPRTRSLNWDRIAGASAEIGVLYVAVTLVTGSLWGRLSWGKYWVWDARLTTTALLFVTYLGYLAVRNLGGTHQQRARRSALVAMFAVVEIPLVHFSVERWNTLHQEESIAKGKVNGLMLFAIFLGVVAFTLMYVWLLLHRQRIMALQDAVDDRGLEHALAERRAEALVGSR
jgi:heme exporter protein C